MHGRSFLFRYADDAVLLFEKEEDARRVFEVLPKRFAKYGLTLHPEKTRLVRFRRPDRDTTDHEGGGGPGTFNFLGFTHHWAQLENGHWVVLRRTKSSSTRRALGEVWAWLKASRHLPLGEQQWGLNEKLRGHYGYFAIRGNMACVWSFWARVKRTWKKWLSRRSDQAWLTWPKFHKLLERYPLLAPSVVVRSKGAA